MSVPSKSKPLALILISFSASTLHAQDAKVYEAVRLVGKLNFEAEFALEVQDSSDARIGRKCLSGYFFPPDMQVEYMKSLNGKIAEVTGKLVRYSDIPSDNPLSDVRRRIKNLCGGEYVLIGQTARVHVN